MDFKPWEGYIIFYFTKVFHSERAERINKSMVHQTIDLWFLDSDLPLIAKSIIFLRDYVGWGSSFVFPKFLLQESGRVEDIMSIDFFHILSLFCCFSFFCISRLGAFRQKRLNIYLLSIFWFEYSDYTQWHKFSKKLLLLVPSFSFFSSEIINQQILLLYGRIKFLCLYIAPLSHHLDITQQWSIVVSGKLLE